MPESNSNNKINILLVDDQPENLFSLEQLLEEDHINFIKAHSGKEALKLALNNEITLILLDVQMPEMDGFEVARILKSSVKTKYIPIIFVTALSRDLSNVLKGYSEGAVDYLLKPLQPEITKAKVDAFIKFYLQQKELEQKDINLENLGLLVKQTPDIMAIILAAQEMIIEDINPACSGILGYTPEEIKGRDIFQYFKPQDIGAIKSLCDVPNIKAGTVIKYENQVICRDTSFRWLTWSAVYKNGKWYANAKDITSQKKVEEELKIKTSELLKINTRLEESINKLEESNRELDAFTYSVSHDLKGPLRLMIGFSRILMKKLKNLNEEEEEFLKLIDQNAAKLNNLIDDLLTLSRFSRKEVKKEPINMKALFRKIIDEFKNNDKDLKAKVKLHDIPETKGDPTLMEQVIINLLSNAFKYSQKKEDPVIEIGSEKEAGYLVYWVKDNGVGFDMTAGSRLFNVFQRLHTEAEFEGTGIGLSIVKRIINKHHGRVWFEAEPDKGATFYFSIPEDVVT